MPEAEQNARAAGKRGFARLAAVQALYQQENQQQSADEILEEFLSYRLGSPIVEEDSAAEVPHSDKAFLSALLTGVAQEQNRLDALIKERLPETWTLPQLDPVVRAILRAGAFELLAMPEIPLSIILNEYIELAKAFFDRREPMFINGILHSIAHSLRPQEQEVTETAKRALPGET
ncbi:MAG: transcription antitermination factor NusB [Holosporales bacterium]|nr:transcription antitermination factor NusB [Holosporales bacterium]